MAQSPSPRRGGAGVLTVIVLVVISLFVLAPKAVGAWIGGLIGEVWATALGALTALLSGLFSGGG